MSGSTLRSGGGTAWKSRCVDSGDGYFTLATEDTGTVPVRLFLTPRLLEDVEDSIYPQVVTATRFPGVRLVVITPDVHHGYGVPVGCAILTDVDAGAIALGPVGFDIGCGMCSLSSAVPAGAATPERRMAFNRAVMRRVRLGAGERGVSRLARIDRAEFERLVRGGAEYYTERYGTRLDRARAERQRIPVDEGWQLPSGRADRGMAQLGSLGGGNHFIELQRSAQSGTLFVQVHTGSRGFGHGLAEMYFQVARAERPAEIQSLDEAWFAADSPRRADYLNAVAAAGNYAIINRLVIAEELAAAFREVFTAELELVYEISHNLVQREWHPDFGEVHVHRKGATRAFPAGHPGLDGTQWATTGHPVLIPGSNRDQSYILRPRNSAKSAYTVNHGAGRRMSRTAARKQLDQRQIDDEYRRQGIVVNLDGRVPIDEAGPAYKSSREVVEAVTRAGLATVEHELWPLASLKGTR
ncbi:MAG: RtcB family protein [Chloroflexi bacterium]|nr:MAG: RtcB family protein [Chloroflexota bacterium]